VPRIVWNKSLPLFVMCQPCAHQVFLERVLLLLLTDSRDLDYVDMENIRIDSLIAERFSSHPRFVDMYAYCGFSQVAEVFRHSDTEDKIVGYDERNELFNPLKEYKLKPRNSFTPSEKLFLALEMVEPLVAMHTYPGGPIVHDDVDLGQYLWADGNFRDIKLNDFNRAGAFLLLRGMDVVVFLLIPNKYTSSSFSFHLAPVRNYAMG